MTTQGQDTLCVYQSRSDFTQFELASIDGVSSGGVNPNILIKLDYAIVKRVNSVPDLGGSGGVLADNAAYRCDDWKLMP